jgi:hypothetical protein
MKTRSEKVLEIYEEISELREEKLDLSEIADSIESMAGYITDEDQEKFDNILDKYLSKVDPDAKMTVGDAVEKLGEKGANSMLKELEKLSYEDPEDGEDKEE